VYHLGRRSGALNWQPCSTVAPPRWLGRLLFGHDGLFAIDKSNKSRSDFIK